MFDRTSDVNSNPAELSALSANGKAALSYARRGWHVFPVSQDKTPLTTHGWHDATVDETVIAKWWTTSPNAGIAIATKPSGLGVLDIDRHEGGADGFVALDGIESEHGPVPDSVCAATGGGGEHYYYLWPVGVEPRTEQDVAPGVDMIGKGYVIAPPTVHQSGECYEWLAEPYGDDIDEVDKMPEWLVDLVRERQEGSTLPTESPSDSGNRNDRPGGTRPRVSGEDGGAIVHDTRNSTMASLAGGMKRRGMSDAAIRAALQADNQHRCDPPLSPDEVDKVARSITRYAPDPEASQPVRPCCKPSKYGLHDMGNAERLGELYGDRLRYCHTWERWLVWDDTRWHVDNTGMSVRLAMRTSRSIRQESRQADDEDLRSRTAKHAVSSCSAGRIKNMLSLARPKLAITPEELDSDPYTLNCRNCTIDLRTGEVRPHSQADYITKLALANYDPDAKCPTWERVINEIFGGDDELIHYFQKALGYSLTGSIREQIMFVADGSGRNGKSTVLGAFQEMLGDYAMTTPAETLLAKKTGSIPNDLARLKGARLVLAHEPDDGKRLGEGTVKQITGGDRVSARFMRAEWFDYRPMFKVWLLTNHLPQVYGQDDGIWRRLKVVPFVMTFSGENDDKDLRHALRKEYPGILAWAVRGHQGYLAEGLVEPPAVLRATGGYRRDMDTVARFIDEACVMSATSKVSARHLYEQYSEWCRKNGETALSQKMFSPQVQAMGIKRVRGTGGRYHYEGVGTNHIDGDGGGGSGEDA